MNIDFKNMNYYYLTNNNKERKTHIEEELKNYNLYEVNSNPKIKVKNKSGISGICKILDLASIHQKITNFTPFAILEDDIKKYREIPENISIPNDADILYVGLSIFGLGPQSNTINTLYINDIDEEIIKVYNILSSHSIIICSIRGLLTYQKSLMESFYKEKPWDNLYASMQPYLNVYALKEPLFYQYGNIGGVDLATKLNFKNNKIAMEEKLYKDIENVYKQNGLELNINAVNINEELKLSIKKELEEYFDGPLLLSYFLDLLFFMRKRSMKMRSTRWK